MEYGTALRTFTATFLSFRGMSDTEEMEPESEICLPASQTGGQDTEQTVSQTVQTNQNGQTDPSQNGKTTKTLKPRKAKEPAGVIQYPCIYCGISAAKGAIQCTICALRCHMSCTGLSKEAIRALEVESQQRQD